MMIFSPEELSALKLSTIFALTAATAGIIPAVGMGYWLAHSRASWKWLIESVANLPLVLPPVVTGYILLLFLAPSGPIGGFCDKIGFKIVFTPYAAIIAAMVVSFPLAMRTTKLAFESVDRKLEQTARTLGASRMETFRQISLPLAKDGIFAGWMLAFARSLGEFGATIMIAGNIAGKTQTIPLAIFAKATQPGGIQQSWRLVALSIIISCIAITLGEKLGKKKSSNVRNKKISGIG